MKSNNNKKIINFSVPLHIVQRIKVKDGKIKLKIRWGFSKRLYNWFKNLIFEAVEINSNYLTIREGYFWIGKSGEIEKRELTIINEETEILEKQIGLSIEMTMK